MLHRLSHRSAGQWFVRPYAQQDGCRTVVVSPAVDVCPDRKKSSGNVELNVVA